MPRIDFEPVGRRIEVPPGTTLLDAARTAGIDLVAVCGGGGTCGTCQVRLITGRLSPVTAYEALQLGEDGLAAGLRLACESLPLEDVRIDLPPQSLTTPQRTQVEGVETAVEVDPPVIGVDLDLAPPTAHDLRADLARLRAALAAAGWAEVSVDPVLWVDFSDQLRVWNWQTRAVIDRWAAPPRLAALLPPGSKLYGLAVDIGTTKLAGYLVDLESGAILARQGAMNPQIAYGEDVIARIAFTNQHENGRSLLQSRLVETLNQLLAEMCTAAGVPAGLVVSAVMVGNTAMHHLFSGLPVRQLGAAPYVPAVNEALVFPAGQVGLGMPPGAPVYLPPNIAGYVGADHVAMLLAAGVSTDEAVTLAVDIGTNTEITLSAGGKVRCCSCASGPAFEGAHIHAGMRAAPGAVERVQIRDEQVLVHTIGNQPAVGICGSGIMDAIGQMVAAGIIDTRGVFARGRAGVHERAGKLEYVLVPAERSGSGQAIPITRSDVNQIQLAKAAIRAGVEVLLAEAKIPASAVERFVIAGAFGTYLDLKNALITGMFPRLPLSRFEQVGNAAGMGARQLLISRGKRREADRVAAENEYIELTTYPDFTNLYVRSMFFEPA